jgi:hypothetical protein
MSRMALRRLIGAALVDRELCDGLMNGRRSAILADFDLTDGEREVLMFREAVSVRELASTVHGWLKERGDSTSPHPRVDYDVMQAL